MLSALAPAMAQTLVYTGDTTPLSVTDDGTNYYVWDLYNDATVDFAKVTGTAVANGDAVFVGGINSGPTVSVQWLKPGTYFFKVTATEKIVGCTSNFKIGIIEVKLSVKAEIAAGPPVCAGEPITLTVTLTGTAPWDYTYTDGINSWTRTNITTSPDVITVAPGPVITTDYWISSVKDVYGTNTTPSDKATQKINPLPAPSLIYHR